MFILIIPHNSYTMADEARRAQTRAASRLAHEEDIGVRRRIPGPPVDILLPVRQAILSFIPQNHHISMQRTASFPIDPAFGIASRSRQPSLGHRLQVLPGEFLSIIRAIFM